MRNGADVSHAGFDGLAEAVAAMREEAKQIRAQGPPKTASMLRDFPPDKQVVGRLQLTGKGFFRKPAAGVDVRGDGAFVPFRGAVKREELDPSKHETPFDLVRETLEAES